MRSYDSPGTVITVLIPEADWAKYPVGDLNVQIGDLAGVTQGPVNTIDGGLLNVCVSEVYNRSVTSANAVTAGAKVYLKADGTLTTTQADGPHFGHTLDAIAAGKTVDVRVRLLG